VPELWTLGENMNAEVSRFVDDGTQMVDFLRRYTVVCPECGGAATVVAKKDEPFILFARRRLTCSGCGLSKEWAAGCLGYPSPEQGVDWYFRLPYFFQRRCAGHQLWVANREHLNFLRGYVAAKHRNHRRDARGWSNRSFASRIPKWLAEAKNRTAILSVLDDLEKEIEKPNKRMQRTRR